MSIYTMVVVFWATTEDESAIKEELERPFGEVGYRLSVRPYYNHPNGQDLMAVGHYRYLNWAALFPFIEGIAWERPDDVQVLLQTSNDPRFGLFELIEGRLAPVNSEAVTQLATMEEDDGWTQASSAIVNSDAALRAILQVVADHFSSGVRVQIDRSGPGAD